MSKDKEEVKSKKAYNIVKEMTNEKTGEKTFVLLNNGMSEIFETSNKAKVKKLVTMYNSNSDTKHVYSYRKVTSN